MRPLSVALELSAAVGLWLLAPGHASGLPSSAARPHARPPAPLRDATAELGRGDPLGENHSGLALRGGGVTPGHTSIGSDSLDELGLGLAGESDRGGGGAVATMANAQASEGGRRQGGAAELCDRIHAGGKVKAAKELVNMADLLQAGGKEEEIAQATKYYVEALALEPENTRALGNFARLLHAQGDFDPAEQLYQKAMALPAESTESAVDILNNYAVFLHSVRKNYPEAMSLYREVLKNRPDDADTHCNYATLLLEVQGQQGTAEAEAHLLRALELRPDDPDALFNYAVLLQELRGDSDKAKATLERILELHPGDLAAAYNHAVIQLEVEKDYGKAEKLCDRILAANPDDLDALYAYGDLLAQRRPEGERDLTRAVEMYRRALAIQPDHPDILVNLAIVLMEQTDVWEAHQTLKRAAKVAPDHQLTNIDGQTISAADLSRQLSLFLEKPLDAQASSPESIAAALDPSRLFKRSLKHSRVPRPLPKPI